MIKKKKRCGIFHSTIEQKQGTQTLERLGAFMLYDPTNKRLIY